MDASTNTILEKILEKLDTLKETPIAYKPDLRIWQPDDSCIPFTIESQIGGAAGNPHILSFEIKQRQRGVIYSVSTSVNNLPPATVTSKDIVRIGIMRLRAVVSAGISQDQGSLIISGDLTRVIERGASASETNVPGLVTWGNNSNYLPFVRPVRIPLDAGQYVVCALGSTFDINHTVSLSGYTYPERER